MTDSERFVDCVLGEPVDRPPLWLLWGPWPSTLRRWHGEGLEDYITEPRLLFDPDMPMLPVAVNCGACPAFKNRVLAEDEHSRTVVDDWGIVKRECKTGESMPQFLEFPVKSRRDWEQYREERLNPDDPERLAGEWRDAVHAWHEAGLPIAVGRYPDSGVFGALRWLLGDEECLMAFCTMPDLVHEIMDHMTSIYLTVFEAVAREVPVQALHMWEDMCGRQGPLIGPDQWRAFMGPQYRRLKAFCDRHNIPVFSVDTDGRPDLIVPPMIEAGVNFLYPLEVAAGCDVHVYQRQYPELAFMGGIDKRVLAQSKQAIDAELARVRLAIERGKYIPDLDHTVPDDVPYENYAHFAQRLKEVVGKE